MARVLRVAMAQVNPTVGDLVGNAGIVRRRLTEAAEAGADVALFPELVVTGYPPEDLLLRPAFIRANLEALAGVAREVGETAAVVGFVDRDRARRLYNAAALIWRGKVRSIYRKVQLPNYGVFDEKRYFTPGMRHPIFEIRGVRLAVAICEDAWSGAEPVRILARAGAEIVAVINASPYHAGKSAERRALARGLAREARIFVPYVQTVGGQDELVFDGDSLAFDPGGRLVARGAQFEEDLVVFDCPLPARPRALRRGADIVRLSSAPAPARPALPRRASRGMGRDEEIYSALVLGTRDYVLKNGFRSVVIGLSGGIDSSLTAVVAADAIGAENVLGVAMPSEFSSPESLEDAKALAGNLGIGFQVIPITRAHHAFLETLADSFAGTATGTAEENIQARVRGVILMALSNKFGHLVLTTGNKSEMAVGYSTLYGDLAGGFAVIKDVPKTTVFALTAWRNSRGAPVIPARVLTKPPSAELRPGQLDTDSLPPYDRLDPILAAYVERNRPVGEIARAAPDAETVRRVVQMVDRSEYKRRQAPPGVKITPLAFGRDRRIPMTNRYREWEDVERRPRGRKGGSR